MLIYKTYNKKDMLNSEMFANTESKKRTNPIIPKRLSALDRRESGPAQHDGGRTPYRDDSETSFNPDEFDRTNINNRFESIGNVMLINNPLMKQKNEDLLNILSSKKKQIIDGPTPIESSFVNI